MRKIMFFLVTGFLAIFLQVIPSHSERYPEYTGNYIEKNNSWVDFQAYQLNVMMLNERTNGGYTTMTYAGFYEIPDNILRFATRKPRMLFYSGRDGTDPRNLALVELGKLPYNNQPIQIADGKQYNGRVKYSKEDTKNQIWIFKREVRLRFKPVEGKIGMYIFEPSEELKDGFYAIDVGIANEEGHKDLRTAPDAMDFYKIGNVQTVMPFVVGSVKDTTAPHETPTTNEAQTTSENKLDDSSTVDTKKVGEDLGAAIINGLFGK